MRRLARVGVPLVSLAAVALAVVAARRPPTGLLVRTVTVNQAFALAVSSRAGRAFISRPNSAHMLVLVLVLDTRAGTLLHPIDLGSARDGLFVDHLVVGEPVIVLGGNAPATPPDPWGWVPARLRRTLPAIPPPPGPRMVPDTVTIVDASRLSG